MDLPYVGVCTNAGMMRTGLGVDLELRGVSSGEVSQGIQWVKSGQQVPHIIIITLERSQCFI
jgi:hypothetical protein